MHGSCMHNLLFQCFGNTVCMQAATVCRVAPIWQHTALDSQHHAASTLRGGKDSLNPSVGPTKFAAQGLTRCCHPLCRLMRQHFALASQHHAALISWGED